MAITTMPVRKAIRIGAPEGRGDEVGRALKGTETLVCALDGEVARSDGAATSATVGGEPVDDSLSLLAPKESVVARGFSGSPPTTAARVVVVTDVPGEDRCEGVPAAPPVAGTGVPS